MLCACCSSASSLESRTGIFSKSVTMWTAPQIPLWSKSHLVFRHKVYKIALSEMPATQMGATEAQRQSQLVWTAQIWMFFASQRVDSPGTRASLCSGLLVSCYGLLQHSRPARFELFVDHTHTHLMNNLRWQPHWLPRLMSLPRKSRDWWRTRDSSLGQPTEEKKSIKNQHFLFFYIYFFPLNLKLVTHLSVISMVILHT